VLFFFCFREERGKKKDTRKVKKEVTYRIKARTQGKKEDGSHPYRKEEKKREDGT